MELIRQKLDSHIEEAVNKKLLSNPDEEFHHDKLIKLVEELHSEPVVRDMCFCHGRDYIDKMVANCMRKYVSPYEITVMSNIVVTTLNEYETAIS